MRLFFIFFFLVCTFCHYSQNEKITIKKEDYSLFFFKSGIKSDTIRANDNTFFLKTGKNRRCDLLIEIENGKLSPYKGDSLYQLVRMPGMNYRHRFVCHSVQNAGKKHTKTQETLSIAGELKTEVNGASSGNPSLITIQFTNQRGDSLLLKNNFYYR